MAKQTISEFSVGDCVCLKSSPACIMTVARIPSEENKDLLTPLQVECVWLDNNLQAHFSRFPLAMLKAAVPPKPIGFKLKQQQ
jgi:hypothetical protein